MKRFCACDNVVHLGQLINVSVTVYLRVGVGVGVRVLWVSLRDRFPDAGTLISSRDRFSRCRNFLRTMQYFYYQIPGIEGGITVHAQTSIQKNYFRFSRPVRHLFPTHPTSENKRSTSEDTFKNSPEVDLESSRSSSKSESWNKPNRRCCDHSWYECRRSNEPRVGHRLESIFCDSSCKVWPRTKECQVYQLWPHTSISRQFASTRWRIFQPFPVLPSWSYGRAFVQLLCLFNRQFTISFNALSRMTFHIVWPRDSFCVRFLSPK